MKRVVKVHQLDTVVCVVYRPPDTRIEEFAGLLQCLDSTLSALPTPSPKVMYFLEIQCGWLAITSSSRAQGRRDS